MPNGEAWIWAGPEPELDAVMSDPLVGLVMRRDGLSSGQVWAAIRTGRRRLAGETVAGGVGETPPAGASPSTASLD